jgi:glucosamine--fructose-6-phosphate aminotransferase (isomerizing)
MCGIVGCIVRDHAARVLVRGLQRLEYRGYDSAGIAVQNGDDIAVHRKVGKIADLLDGLDLDRLTGGAGVGHTRWATHGRPSEENAHPIDEGDGNLYLVHNGIIDNHKELKTELEGKGRRFVSQTDTEVIAHLIEESLEDDLEEAVRKALRRLRGSFAIALIHRRFPGVVIGARQDSPLVVGYGDGEYFLASDIPPLLGHTRDVLILEDGEVVRMTADGVRVTNLEGAVIDRGPTRIEWDLLMAEKGGYKHFMLKEIHEQARVISDSLLGRIDLDAGDAILPEIRLRDEEVRDLRKVVVVGCGTSWHAGLVGKFLLESLARIPVEVDIGSEFRYRDSILDERSLVLAITQSGETADTLAAIRKARQVGAKTMAICNVIGSSASRDAGGVVYTQAGPEIGVASTKAFVSQLIVLHLVGVFLGRRLGTLDAQRARRHLEELRAVRKHIQSVLDRFDEIQEISAKYSQVDDFLYLGRGVNFPIALEGALKLKEISYIHAEGYPAGEMKHGPIALIDEKVPVLAIATPGRTYVKMVASMDQVKARGGRVIAVVSDEEEDPPDAADDLIRVPACREEFSPIVNVVPLQIFAYQVAVRRGCDVDQPRNLAKSVTVE